MKQEITQSKISALSIMGGRLNVDPNKLMETLKATVFKGASDNELLALVVVANEFNLNPLTKQIYAFPAKGGGIVPVVSIDGWVSMVNDHPAMDGMEFEEHCGEGGKLEAITCKLWRKDRSRPISVTEHLSECKRNTDPWKMEHRMLRHKALMQCARYAFGFSGIQDEDEATITAMRDVTPISKVMAAPRIANPYAEPEPEPTTEAPPESPVEVSEETERAAIVHDIKTALKATEDTGATFTAKCREAGIIANGAKLMDAPIGSLRDAFTNLSDICSGEYIPMA